MNIRRRLLSLECRPFRRPVAQRDDFAVTPLLAEALRKLCLPLPKLADDDERAECLRLMVAAQARTRIDRVDTGGWDTLRDYAIGLHSRYGTTPYWDTVPGDGIQDV